MRPDKPTQCPTPERIEAHRTGEGDAQTAAHIERCPECRRVLDELDALARGLLDARHEVAPPPPEIEMAIMDAYRKEFAKPAGKVVRPVRWWRLAVPLAAAASVALLAVSINKHKPATVAELSKPVVLAEAEKVAADSDSAALEKPAAARMLAKEGVNEATPSEPRAVAKPSTDIRSAYQLALALKAGRTLEGRWDVNDDQTVDQADVQELARMAVQVVKG